MEVLNFDHILSAVVFSLIGIVVLILAGWLFDKLTPGDAWVEISEKKNTAMAIAIGAVMISLGIIIASAIHG